MLFESLASCTVTHLLHGAHCTACVMCVCVCVCVCCVLCVCAVCMACVWCVNTIQHAHAFISMQMFSATSKLLIYSDFFNKVDAVGGCHVRVGALAHALVHCAVMHARPGCLLRLMDEHRRRRPECASPSPLPPRTRSPPFAQSPRPIASLA